MANTYSQLNIQVVFAVKGRENVISETFNKQLYKYISGIINNLGQYSLAVNGHLDHVHVFFELMPSSSISDVVRVVKTNSSKWINENRFVKEKFRWQEGYGAFSYSRSQRNRVINYIANQKEHHAKVSFQEEYMDLLEKFQIEFDDKYIFDFYN